MVVKQNNFMQDLDMDIMNDEDPHEQLLTTPRVMDHKSISKSEYTPSKSISLTNPENNY